jgi:hypothetical protein
LLLYEVSLLSLSQVDFGCVVSDAQVFGGPGEDFGAGEFWVLEDEVQD